MAEPGALSEGDPRNAEYFENIAAIQHIYERQKSEAAEGRANAKTNAAYSESQLTKQEPGGFRNLRNRAGKEGLTHSGILGGRTGNLASQYAARRYGITHGLQETENRLTRGEQRAKESAESGEHNAVTRALEQRKQWLLENPNAAVELGMMNKPAAAAAAPKPPAPPKAPSAVPTAKVIGRQPRTGGVHGYARRVAAKKMFASTGGVRAR